MKRRNKELDEMFNNAGEKIKDEVGKMDQQMEQYLKSAKELKNMGYVHDEVEAKS